MTERATNPDLLLDHNDPWPKKETAKMFMVRNRLSFDVWEIIEYSGGFAISKKAYARAFEDQPKQEGAPQERYYRVRFHDKARDDDTNDVTLQVNGEGLTIARGQVIVLPERFVECARNAVYPVYRQLPNEDRKVTGRVMHAPFDMMGEATEEQYKKMKAEGTAKLRESVGDFVTVQ